MAWQKGPGEGYRAAKDDALEINPRLRCKAVRYRGEIAGYIVTDDETKPSLGKAISARDAWCEALGRLQQRAAEAVLSARTPPA